MPEHLSPTSNIRGSGNGTGRHHSASATSGCQCDLHWIPVANHMVLDHHRHPMSSTTSQWTLPDMEKWAISDLFVTETGLYSFCSDLNGPELVVSKIGNISCQIFRTE
ncbi:hypothetical protein DFH08DRAFT_799884 [Mycena albidolilacea]|uniref:Uncharacterized protein n=1 Tax=Mycena albidolilacea TaxID=1033008 RepID=A0AAD7AMH3_9AGAR|nr:hypothetical protein DFH08DRAFT_799884 [Mycena albidolilacea]